MPVEVKEIIAYAESLVQTNWQVVVVGRNFVFLVAPVVETAKLSLRSGLGKRLEDHVEWTMVLLLVSMDEGRVVVALAIQETWEVVGQVGFHIGLVFVRRLHSALEESSE